MKKIFSVVALAATMTISSCGLGGGSTNNAGNILGTLATSALTGGTTNNTSTGSNLASTGLNILSSLLGGGSMSTQGIVGTWNYQQPQVSFESKSILGSIGGELAGNKIENILGTQLEKIGLKAGASSFTFDNSGNVTINMKGKTTKGTYTLNGNALTMKGALGLTTINCTVTVNNNQLYMLFDATSLFNAITKLGASSNAISSLLGNFNGMKLGWSMTK